VRKFVIDGIEDWWHILQAYNVNEMIVNVQQSHFCGMSLQYGKQTGEDLEDC